MINHTDKQNCGLVCHMIMMMIIDDSDYSDIAVWVFIFASEVSGNYFAFILVYILLTLNNFFMRG
jgi:hypothetical protein